jgi:hypothetical protein
MKQVPEKLQPWLIAGWFVAFYFWNLYFAWSAAPAPYTTDDYNRILLEAAGEFLTPDHIFLSAIVVAAVLIKWKK